MKNNDGMTLLELVTAMAIAGVMMLIAGALVNSMMTRFDDADKSSNVADLQETLRAMLTSTAQCSANFKDKEISMAVPNGLSLQKISAYDKNNTAVSSVLELNKDYRGISLDRLTLKPVAELSNNLMVANVESVYRKTSAPTGANEIIRVVPVFVKLAGGKITECWSRKDQGATIVDAGILCAVSTGGTSVSYDPVTKTCVQNQGQWYRGTLTSATCPPGTKLGPNAGAYSACRGDPDGAVFVDPVAQVPVKLQNGQSIPASRPAMMQDLKNGTCECHWADDLPASSLVGATCDIYCFKQ